MRSRGFSVGPALAAIAASSPPIHSGRGRRKPSPIRVDHAGTREAARRVRQAERDRENRLARAEPEATRNGFGRSRRGLLVDCSQ